MHGTKGVSILFPGLAAGLGLGQELELELEADKVLPLHLNLTESHPSKANCRLVSQHCGKFTTHEDTHTNT